MSPYIIPGLKYRDTKILKSDVIIEMVCDYCHLTFSQVKEKNRERDVVLARHICYYFFKKYTDLSLIKMSAHFTGDINNKKRCGQDHTTAINGIRKINDLLSVKDDVVTTAVNSIEDKLYFKTYGIK